MLQQIQGYYLFFKSFETKALNQAVKRNIKRFPPDFMFQLTFEEVSSMRSQFVTAYQRNTSAPPFAFTEQGVAMLSGLLKSDVAIAANNRFGLVVLLI